MEMVVVVVAAGSSEGRSSVRRGVGEAGAGGRRERK